MTHDDLCVAVLEADQGLLMKTAGIYPGYILTVPDDIKNRVQGHTADDIQRVIQSFEASLISEGDWTHEQVAMGGRVSRRELEKPITHHKLIKPAGYIDVYLGGERLEIGWEEDRRSLVRAYLPSCFVRRFGIAIEVKPKIKSLGALMRQLKMYRSLIDRQWEDFPMTTFGVVTFSMEFSPTLEKQGVFVADANKFAIQPNFDGWSVLGASR